MKPGIKKLFSFGSQEFFSGISPSAHAGGGMFYKGLGINPFVDPFPESVNVGLLQMSERPTDISGAVVTDGAMAGVSRITGASAGNLYLIGNTGNLYNKDLSDDLTPTALRTGGSAIASPANGLNIFKPLDGTEYLYYWQNQQIGRWDLASSHPSGYVDNWETGLANTAYHPTHPFQGEIFYGNKERIGKIYRFSDGSATSSTSVLPFPSDFITTCLEDDGYHLVAGLTKSVGSNTLKAETKIIFWDTISQRANKEWPLPDYSINGIEKLGTGFLAFGGRGVYYFDFNTKPKKIKSLNAALALRYGFPFAADVFNDAVLWGGDTIISSYGKIVPEAPNAYFQPFFGVTGNVVFVDAQSRLNRIYAGTTTNLYSYTLTSGGGTTTTKPETAYIDLGQESDLMEIDILLGEPLATDDLLVLDYQTDEDNAAAEYGTLRFSTDGTKRRIRLKKEIRANQVKLLFNFLGGNVKIKRITGYGRPTNY